MKTTQTEAQQAPKSDAPREAPPDPSALVVRMLKPLHRGIVLYRTGELAGFPPEVAYQLILEQRVTPHGWTPEPEAEQRAALVLFEEMERRRGNHPAEDWLRDPRIKRVYERLGRLLGVARGEEQSK